MQIGIPLSLIPSNRSASLPGANVSLFDPRTISNLFLWYKVDGTIYQDSARTIKVTSNNDPVSSLNDYSGNGRNTYVSNANYRPIYKTNIQNVLPVILSPFQELLR